MDIIRKKVSRNIDPIDPIVPLRKGKAMNELAKEARRKYYRKYYDEHPEAREKKNAYRREWGKKPENKEKLKKYVEDFWIRKSKMEGKQ